MAFRSHRTYVPFGSVLVMALLLVLPGQAAANHPRTTRDASPSSIVTSPTPVTPFPTPLVTPSPASGQVLPVPVGAPETGGGGSADTVVPLVAGAGLIGGVAALAGAVFVNARARRRAGQQ